MYITFESNLNLSFVGKPWSSDMFLRIDSFQKCFLGLNLGAKQDRNTRGVTINPPKKNLIPRFKARTRIGETRLHLVDQRSPERLHDFEY